MLSHQGWGVGDGFVLFAAPAISFKSAGGILQKIMPIQKLQEFSFFQLTIFFQTSLFSYFA